MHELVFGFIPFSVLLATLIYDIVMISVFSDTIISFSEYLKKDETKKTKWKKICYAIAIGLQIQMFLLVQYSLFFYSSR